MKKIAIVPGSYDPVTYGHLDLIKRAAAMFDKVYATVLVNGEKQGCFTTEEKTQLLRCACRGMENVEIISHSGLTSDLLKELGAKFIVKGARNATDFDYEHSLTEIMRQLSPDCDTVILPSRPELFHVSSTYARELLKYGCELSDVADSETAALMRELYNK